MVLRMPCPTKRKGSDRWYFRRTIPADVQRILAKLAPGKRPRNWYAKHIVISLGTADRDRAKSKCPEVAAAVERQLKALREGPKPLTVKQIAALSGEVYKGFAEGLEDNPVLSAAQWRDIAAGNRRLRNANPLLIDPDDPEFRAERLERQFGKMADAIIARYAVVTDEQSRWKLVERLSIDVPEAADKLARNADADYSPDPYVQRFPTWESETQGPSTKRTISGLAHAWHEAALARNVTARDANRFKRIVLRFAEWLGHDGLERV